MSGPFYFAWVDSGDSVFAPSAHAREDEQILSVVLSQQEGDFAALEIEIANPRIGLLAPGRKVWAWLSYRLETTGDIVPLFFGRLIGAPDNLDRETITLHFLARPLNYQAQKVTVANSLRVAPYWDPIWFKPEDRDNPDNILESRPELWHIDRTTLAVTTSHILTGEDGLVVFDDGQVFYDSVTVSYADMPARQVDVVASVSWDQIASGTLDFSSYLALGGWNLIRTYTGEGLVSNWPKAGTSAGSGWTVAASEARVISGNWPVERQYTRDGFVNDLVAIDPKEFERQWTIRHNVLKIKIALQVWNNAQGADVRHFFSPKYLAVPLWEIQPYLVMAYDAKRRREETVQFSLLADTQAIVTDPGDADVIKVSLSSSELMTPIDDGGAMPIGDLRNAVYFGLPRGASSLEYLIALARSRLLIRARAVKISFAVSFLDAINNGISLRKDAYITDPRLPGGYAVGKIIEYKFSVQGDSGAAICELTIGCTIGHGGTVQAVDGDPTYVEVGYVDSGYQRYINQFVMPFAGEVVYESQLGYPPNDDGIDFYRASIPYFLRSIMKEKGFAEQESLWAQSEKAADAILKMINDTATSFRLELKSVTGGPYTTIYNPALSVLKVPKTIDLEAPSQ